MENNLIINLNYIQAPPPAGSAWGPRPGGGSAPPAAPGGGPTPRPQGPPVAGRASTRPTTERVTEQMSRVDIGKYFKGILI